MPNELTPVSPEGQLSPGATIRKFRIVQTEGARQVPRMVATTPTCDFDRFVGEGGDGE
ncbi:MAG: hypothetical protein SAMD01599839_20200 [Rectinema sp.]